MQKTIMAILIGLCIAGLIFFVVRSGNKLTTVQSSNEKIVQNQTISDEKGAEKIEVVHFHGTHQCWSCITVGEYALKTIKEKFLEEYLSGKIIYLDINGELPENRDIVIKYQARGSSLFVNAIKGGQDNIEEDITVWRQVSNEDQFISYFQNKINKLLGK